MGPRPHLWFWAHITASLTQEKKTLLVPALTCGFVHAKQRLLGLNYKSLRVKDITCRFCMQNSAFWTRVTSLYGSHAWPVVLCMYNSGLNIRITSLYGSQPSSVVFACKTAWLASESLVSMGPSPHVWFLDAKQRLMDQNNKSLRVPDTTCRFVLVKQRDLH